MDGSDLRFLPRVGLFFPPILRLLPVGKGEILRGPARHFSRAQLTAISSAPSKTMKALSNAVASSVSTPAIRNRKRAPLGTS